MDRELSNLDGSLTAPPAQKAPDQPALPLTVTQNIGSNQGTVVGVLTGGVQTPELDRTPEDTRKSRWWNSPWLVTIVGGAAAAVIAGMLLVLLR